jgi:hypothetical protein
MTSSLLAPKCKRRPDLGRSDSRGSAEATPTLDHRSAAIRALVAEIGTREPRELLRTAHQRIVAAIRPVYAMEDLQPASITVLRARGSCSQRLAVLEAVARASGIRTRVRGIEVDGSFWYPRFPRLKALVPNDVVLAWPEFRVDGAWLQVGELYGSLEDMSACGVGFSNADGETLFDAIGRTAIDWDGRTGVASCDLSAVVKRDLGTFDSRDKLFRSHGQTLAWLPRRVADPVMSRRSARP